MKKSIEIIRIKEIYKIDNFKIFCLFTNEENRFIDFKELFEKWNISEKDNEYKLLDLNEFQKVSINNGTLCWRNIEIYLLDENGNEKKFSYEIDPIVLYQNSQIDKEKIIENIGLLLKTERLKSGLTTKQLAKKSGVSEKYITKLENEKSNIELFIINDIFRTGLGKKIKIEVE